MRISFLTPKLPPAVCGVADHSQRLAQAMQAAGVEVGFIHCQPQAAEGSLPAGPVDQWHGSPRDLERCVFRQDPDWLWVQLSSYGYSRWGAPLLLGRALAALRRAAPRLGIVVCAHETHCRPQQLGAKGHLLSPWQRYTVGAVVRRADLVFTSIARYQRQIIQEYRVPADKVARLPIGSNVALPCLSSVERERARQALGWGPQEIVVVSFGSYASQLRALRQCGSHLARGLASRQLDRIVCLGGDGTAVPREFGRWAKGFAPTGSFQVLGYQPERAVGEILECADFALCPYPSERLGKSASFVTCSMAGLPVLVAGGKAGDELSEDEQPFLSVDSWDWSQARSAEVAVLRRRLREHAATHSTWPAIAQRALAVMSDAAGRRVGEPIKV